jgi:hypothetical protein
MAHAPAKAQPKGERCERNAYEPTIFYDGNGIKRNTTLKSKRDDESHGYDEYNHKPQQRENASNQTLDVNHGSPRSYRKAKGKT